MQTFFMIKTIIVSVTSDDMLEIGRWPFWKTIIVDLSEKLVKDQNHRLELNLRP